MIKDAMIQSAQYLSLFDFRFFYDHGFSSVQYARDKSYNITIQNSLFILLINIDKKLLTCLVYCIMSNEYTYIEIEKTLSNAS